MAILNYDSLYGGRYSSQTHPEYRSSDLPAEPTCLSNPLNAQLNPICHLLEMLGAHPILHVSRIRVKIST
jgi:hypothetical protein